MCVIEAMAAGKPVIATRAGGLEELVVDGETGFIVPPKDIEALATAIRSLISLSDKGKGMGQRGKEIAAEKFSIQLVAKKTTDLFFSLAGVKR